MGEVYSHLSEEERQVIQIEVGNGTSVREDGPFAGAQCLHRQQGGQAQHVVPVQRERILSAVPAQTVEDVTLDGPVLHRRARAAQGRPETRRLSYNWLWAWVAGKPGCGWSPLLISGSLRVLFPDDPSMRVCPETVYRWICSSRSRRERWARCLPRGHRRRRKRGGRRASRFPMPERVSISRRPPVADDRSGFGHWEADGVIGAGTNLHTEVEGKTRYPMARIAPPTRPPTKASGPNWLCSRHCPEAHASASRTTMAPNPPATPGRAASWGWTRISPIPIPAGSGEAARTATASSAATCPNAARSGRIWRGT